MIIMNGFCSVRIGIMVCTHISHSVHPNWTLSFMSLASHCTLPVQWGGWDAKIQELVPFSNCCKAPWGTGRVERGQSRAQLRLVGLVYNYVNQSLFYFMSVHIEVILFY